MLSAPLHWPAGSDTQAIVSAGVPATELQLPNKRTRVKQEPEEQLEHDSPAAAASGEASDEEEPEDVKRADGDAGPARPQSVGASRSPEMSGMTCDLLTPMRHLGRDFKFLQQPLER
jgi:hypothetical protein